MRQFAARGLRIWNLPGEAKLVYAFFCVLSLFAMLSSLLLYEDLVGPTLRPGHTRRIADYYSDDAAPAQPSIAPPPAGKTGGPAIALPPDEAADPAPAGAVDAAAQPSGAPAVRRLTITVPYRKLLEVTHFHLFTVPVFLLILTHLFLLTGLSRRALIGWVSAGWISGTLHIAAPWLVRWLGARQAWLFALSGGLFLVASLVLCVYPLWVMWRPRQRRVAAHTAHAPSAAPPDDDRAAPSDRDAPALDTTTPSRVDTE